MVEVIYYFMHAYLIYVFIYLSIYFLISYVLYILHCLCFIFKTNSSKNLK